MGLNDFQANSHRFDHRLLKSQAGKRITRIIFDEAQEYLGLYPARVFDRMLQDTSGLKVQRVFLTGTLPVRLEALFLKKVYLNQSPSTRTIIRMDTFRKGLAHHVLHTSDKDNMELMWSTQSLAQTLAKHLKSHERMIIFVPGIPQGERLSKNLKSACYDAKLEDTVKTANLGRWLRGKDTKTMVATTALIQGIDVAHIRFVIFHEMTFGLVTYYQGAGRGGRSGSRCDVSSAGRRQARQRRKSLTCRQRRSGGTSGQRRDAA